MGAGVHRRFGLIASRGRRPRVEVVAVSTYDNIGIRSRFSARYRQKTRYVYNELNQLISLDGPDNSKQYEYDPRGNLKKILVNGNPDSAFIFDATGMMTSATTPNGQIEHLYNGLGKRTSSDSTSDKLDPATRIDYLLDLTKPYNDLLGTTQDGMKQNYLWGIDAIGATSSDVSQYYLHDHLGSPTRLLDGAGQTSSQYVFDEFGVPIIDPSLTSDGNSNTLHNPFGFTGYQGDEVTDFWFAQARYYNSNVGRFTSEDVHWGASNRIFGDVDRFLPDNPSIKQSSNLFSYCINNPILYSDPTGKEIWLIHGTILNPWNTTPGSETWTSEFQDYIGAHFGENVHTPFEWTGKNSKPAREIAAVDLVEQIVAFHNQNPNEPIRLVTHSHGTNVGIMAANELWETHGIKVDTLIAFAAPQRTDYVLTAPIGQHVNIYNYGDLTQIGATFSPNSWPGGRKKSGVDNIGASPSFWRTILTGLLPGGMLVKLYQGFVTNHCGMHSDVGFWKKYVAGTLGFEDFNCGM